MRYAGQDSTMLAVSPIGETAGRLLAGYPGVKFPEKLTGRGLERNHFLRGGIGEESPPDNDRACFQTALFGRIELPCLF